MIINIKRNLVLKTFELCYCTGLMHTCCLPPPFPQRCMCDHGVSEVDGELSLKTKKKYHVIKVGSKVDLPC